MKISGRLLLLSGVLLVQSAVVVSPCRGDRFRSPGIVPGPQIHHMIVVGEHKNGKLATKIIPFNNPRLDRFTTVTWTNNAAVPIRIRFGKGPECREASDTILRELDWRLEKTCYVTKQPIPPGGVLDTRFSEQGSYPYEVEYIGVDSAETGNITIY